MQNSDEQLLKNLFFYGDDMRICAKGRVDKGS